MSTMPALKKWKQEGQRWKGIWKGIWLSDQFQVSMGI